MLQANYRRKVEGRQRAPGGGLNRNAVKKKATSAKSMFRRKIGKRERARSTSSLPLPPLRGLPRVITVHRVYASHTPPRLLTIPPRMLLIAASWQSKLSHTRPRHDEESLSTLQFSEQFFAADGTSRMFQYVFCVSRRADTCFFSLSLKTKRCRCSVTYPHFFPKSLWLPLQEQE